MPFTRVAIPAGTSPAHKAAIARGVHEAMVAAIGIPEDDFFRLPSGNRFGGRTGMETAMRKEAGA